MSDFRDQKCGGCRFFSGAIGFCRRFPPDAVNLITQGQGPELIATGLLMAAVQVDSLPARYPLVGKEHQACGEFIEGCVPGNGAAS